MGRGRGVRCQHLHKSVHLGAVGKIYVVGAQLAGIPAAQLGHFGQVAAALGQNQRVGRGVVQQPLDQRAAHIAGGAGDQVSICHGKNLPYKSLKLFGKPGLDDAAGDPLAVLIGDDSLDLSLAADLAHTLHGALDG